MNVNWKKIMAIGLAVFSVGMMGCASKEQANNDYLVCNQTSNGQMAETKDGYFYSCDGFLYYADKDHLENWVLVCNKPDCIHTDSMCNAEVPMKGNIWQKDGKLYGMAYGMVDGMPIEIPYIYELLTDGSGVKKIYEVPIKEGVHPDGYSVALFQDEFLLHYTYLDEKGLHQNNIICLREDNNEDVVTSTLYEDTNPTIVMSGNTYYSIRGDNVFVTNLYLDDVKDLLKNFCIRDGETIKQLNIPNDISAYGGHIVF